MEPDQTTVSSIEIHPNQKWKKLISVLTIFFSGLSIYTIYLTFLQNSCDGIGCIEMLPFAIPLLLAYPSIYYLSQIINEGLIDAIVIAPSLFKFYAFFIVFTQLFILGCIVVWVYIDFKRWKNPNKAQENISNDVKYVIKRFALNHFIIFFIFSVFNFVAYTPAPFVPDHEIQLYCDTHNNEQCFTQFINYKIPDCSGSGSMFLWPYTPEIEKPDNCKLANFSKFANFEIFNLKDSVLLSKYPETFPNTYKFEYASGKHGLKNIGDLVYVTTTSNDIEISQTSIQGVLYRETDLVNKISTGEGGLWPGNVRTNLDIDSINNTAVYLEYVSKLYNGYYTDRNYEVVHFIKGNTYFKVSNEKQFNSKTNDTEELRQERINLLKDIAKNFIDQSNTTERK